MKLSHLFLTLLLLLPFELIATAPLVKPNELCRCEDPQTRHNQQPPLSYSFGRHQGKCIDDCTFRMSNLKIDRAGIAKLTNIIHKNNFHDFKFHLDDIESVSILFEYFTTKIQHVAVIFHLKSQREKGIDSFVISPEGVPPKNYNYSFIDGLRGHYVLTYQVYSLEHYLENAKEQGYTLKLKQSNLSKKEAIKALKNVVSKIQNDSFTIKYDLLNNNCASRSIDIISSTRTHRATNDTISLASILRNIPLTRIGTERYLQQSKLVSNKSRYMLIRGERLEH